MLSQNGGSPVVMLGSSPTSLIFFFNSQFLYFSQKMDKFSIDKFSQSNCYIIIGECGSIM